MTPAEIKKTRLYRTLAPCVRKKDREELARMLAMVEPRDSPFWTGFDGTCLGSAFLWSETPQGSVYWSEFAYRLVKAGHFD